jgi:hypothetical protein
LEVVGLPDARLAGIAVEIIGDGIKQGVVVVGDGEGERLLFLPYEIPYKFPSFKKGSDAAVPA